MKYIIITIILIVITILIVFTKWVFSESLYFSKNSIKYHILISKKLKKIPLYNPVDNGIYYYSSGDSGVQGREAVSFHSNIDRDIIITKYKKYFIEKSVVKDNILIASYEKFTFLIKIKNIKEKYNMVTIEHMEN
jgi:hypothetical protein